MTRRQKHFGLCLCGLITFSVLLFFLVFPPEIRRAEVEPWMIYKKLASLEAEKVSKEIVIDGVKEQKEARKVRALKRRLDGKPPIISLSQIGREESLYPASGLNFHKEEELLYFKFRWNGVPQTCGGCNGELSTSPHYSENSTPPIFVWLCRRCHILAHESLHLDRFVRVDW